MTPTEFRVAVEETKESLQLLASKIDADLLEAINHLQVILLAMQEGN